ncbi:hypothetical protein ACLKA7_017623 [Drosophila subpalustris]
MAGTYWYLEHTTTRRKIILQSGENTLGRHSSCKLALTEYLFLSRHHANFIVRNDRRVTVESMNALNGVYINNKKLIGDKYPLLCGDTIGLGVFTDSRQTDVPANHAIFVLKQAHTNAEEIHYISSDEDEAGENAANQIPQPPEVEVEVEQAASSSGNRTIHLPKLPEVKKELISQQSKEIEDIFGDPDDELLESVYQINPYVYKELNNNNNNNKKIGDQICDGDVIDLHEELHNNNQLNNVNGNANDNDDYDELMAMSQAVLQEMKEEMADEPGNNLSGEDDVTDLDEEAPTNHVNDYDEYFAMSQAVLQEMKAEMADSDENENLNQNRNFLEPLDVVTRIEDDDEIIVIEDNDDDELFNQKLADWSSKLLSQNVLSQVYPAEDATENENVVNRQQQHKDDNGDEESNLFTRRPSKSLRIESSDDDDKDDDEDDDNPLSNLAIGPPAKETTTLKPCRVRLKSIDVAKYLQEDDDVVAAESADCPANNKQILEVQLVPQLPKSKQKTSKIRKRRPEISSRSELENEKQSERTATKLQETKEDSTSIVASEEPPQKKRCNSRSRSKSCNMAEAVEKEQPVASKTSTEVKAQTEAAAKSITMRKRSKSISARSELCANNAETPKTVEKEPVDPKTSTTSTAEAKAQTDDAAKSFTKSSISARSELCDNNVEPAKTADKNTGKELKGKSMEHVQNMEHVPVAEAAKKNLGSSRLRQRSKSCYIERPVELADADAPNPTRSALCNDIKKILELRRISISTRPEFCEDANKSKELNAPTTPAKIKQLPQHIESKEALNESPQTADANKSKELKPKSLEETQNAPTTPAEIKHSEAKESKLETKQKSPRLLNRSKSCLLDRLISPEMGQRGPKLVTAPHLPVHRGKLRAVSAEQKKQTTKETAKIDAVLSRQRTRDYETEMKKKWHQKPKDKKREQEQNKKLRREQLQKLAEKSKMATPSSNANDPRRKQFHVPTVGNCNRGEFLTKDVQPTMPKKAKQENEEEKGKKREKQPVKSLPKRRATIECFSQELNVTSKDIVKSPPFHYSRPPERKEAEKARSQRTCNRVTFADMDRDFQYRQDLNKMSKRNRHVRFNDNIQIKYIERVEGADKKVRNVKDTKKFSLSRYAERREWALAKGKLENYTDLITGNILSWGNQWLSLRSANDVAEKDVLLPIPTEFKSYKQYKETIIPLMKLELLTTIEREYESSKSSSIGTFEVSLQSFSRDDKRHRPRFLLVTRYNEKPAKKFDLYTLCSGDDLKETFATLPSIQRIAGKVFELTFEILQKDVSSRVLESVRTKAITVRPVVDNMRVELGAFNAVYQLGRSPLFQRILRPSENVLSFDRKGLKGTRYRGFTKLNEHQTDICLSTWIRLTDDSTPSITLIQGPPGTGKSMVITNLTLQCLYGSTNHTLDRKILICAHSNAAVDNITLSLNAARNCMGHSKFRLLRFGWFEKMDAKVREVSLEHLLGQAQAEKRKRLTQENLDILLQQQLELQMEIAELKQRANIQSYLQQQLQAKEQQLRLITERLNAPLTPREEYELSRNHVQRANIVCTTLSSCVKLANFIDYFDACIIDEATQCTEPWTLLPLQFAVRGLVLVGDTQQLPATVLSQKALEFGLGNSMFDRIQRNLKQKLNHSVHTKVFKLSMQYRMHPEICRWPNTYFYDGDLVNGDGTHNLSSPILPYCVVNLSFTRDSSDTSSRSISNYEEARFVAKLLMELDKHLPTQRFRYGLITPYSNQCQVLSKLIPREMLITPHTVDAYQGQERDVVILSNARTRGVGFLTNYQRLNVAITRPRRCLIICGNFDDLQAVDMWRHLLDDARKRNIYFDLKRQDVDDLNRSLIRKILVNPNKMKKNSPVNQTSAK